MTVAKSILSTEPTSIVRQKVTIGHMCVPLSREPRLDHAHPSSLPAASSGIS